MRAVLWVIGFVVIFAAVSTGLVALGRTFLGGTTPLWQGAVQGVVLGVGTLLVMWAERRGWITIWPGRNPRIEARKQQLQEDRERILAEAKAKAPGSAGQAH